MPLDLWSIYIPLSLAPIGPLTLIVIPNILPSRFTSLAPSSQAGPLGISVISLEIIRSAKSLLSRQILVGTQAGDVLTRIQTMCEVDAVLTVYLLTALVAHLPTITYVCSPSLSPVPILQPQLILFQSLLKSRPTPSNPYPATPRALHLLPLVYTYALIPILPILADAGIHGFGTQRPQNIVGLDGATGFGQWWGMYCVERGTWWRIARPATLLPPLVLTLPLALALFASLYSNLGHPSSQIRPSQRSKFGAVTVLAAALGGIAYLIMEQIKGWSEEWWARIFETVPSFVIVVMYASYPGLWRTYWHWIRFSRPPPASDIVKDLPLPSYSHSFALKRPTSSFYAPSPLPLHRTLPQEGEAPPRRDNTEVPSLKMRYFAHSAHSADSLQPLSPLSQYSNPAYPQPAITASRQDGPTVGPSAWHGQAPLPSPSPQRSARNTIRSFFGLIQSTPSQERSREVLRSSNGSAPFTWSVSVSEPDTALANHLAVHTKARRSSRGVRSDDASSVSRYSFDSVAAPIDRNAGLETIGREVDRRDGAQSGSKSMMRDWVYPEEVFVDFRTGPDGDPRAGRKKRYDIQRI